MEKYDNDNNRVPDGPDKPCTGGRCENDLVIRIKRKHLRIIGIALLFLLAYSLGSVKFTVNPLRRVPRFFHPRVSAGLEVYVRDAPDMVVPDVREIYIAPEIPDVPEEPDYPRGGRNYWNGWYGETSERVNLEEFLNELKIRVKDAQAGAKEQFYGFDIEAIKDFEERAITEGRKEEETLRDKIANDDLVAETELKLREIFGEIYFRRGR